MRKKDYQLLAEAYEDSVSQGGPLGGGKSAPSSSQPSIEQDGEESEGLMGLVAKLLMGVEDGSIDEGDACEHIQMILSGESEDDTMEEDEDDYSEDEEKNTKRFSGQKNTDQMRGQFTKNKSTANVKRPQPDRNVQGINRSTSHYQQGM